MSLNWNIEKCKDYKELTTEENWSTTDTIIWLCMAVGIGTITKKNYKEFYGRVSVYEKLHGTYKGTMKDEQWQPIYTTLEDIERRIGLSTNVGTIPRNTFIKFKVNRYIQAITEAVDEE